MNSSKVTYFKDGITVMARGDKINGKYTEYWPNGKKHKECTYTNGKSNGDEIYFDKTGKTVYDNQHCIMQ